MFDKASIKLLQLLMKSKCVNELQSYPINKILPLVDWSYSKTYNIIVELLKEGYIGKGMKDERADTFYITDKGVCTLTTIISKIRREGEAVVNER